MIDVVTRVPVEELEYPVHDDIISDVEVLVKELAKLLSVQFGIDALGFLKNHHNLSELSICILLGYRCLTCSGKKKALVNTFSEYCDLRDGCAHHDMIVKVQQSVDLVLGEVRLLQQDLHLLLVVLVGLAGGRVADGHCTRHQLSRIFYINTIVLQSLAAMALLSW